MHDNQQGWFAAQDRNTWQYHGSSGAWGGHSWGASAWKPADWTGGYNAPSVAVSPSAAAAPAPEPEPTPSPAAPLAAVAPSAAGAPSAGPVMNDEIAVLPDPSGDLDDMDIALRAELFNEVFGVNDACGNPLHVDNGIAANPAGGSGVGMPASTNDGLPASPPAPLESEIPGDDTLLPNTVPCELPGSDMPAACATAAAADVQARVSALRRGIVAGQPGGGDVVGAPLTEAKLSAARDAASALASAATSTEASSALPHTVDSDMAVSALAAADASASSPTPASSVAGVATSSAPTLSVASAAESSDMAIAVTGEAGANASPAAHPPSNAVDVHDAAADAAEASAWAAHSANSGRTTEEQWWGGRSWYDYGSGSDHYGWGGPSRDIAQRRIDFAMQRPHTCDNLDGAADHAHGTSPDDDMADSEAGGTKRREMTPEQRDAHNARMRFNRSLKSRGLSQRICITMCICTITLVASSAYNSVWVSIHSCL